MCHKNKNTKGGPSNIKHGKHDKKVNNTTNNEDKKKDDSANHLYTTGNNNAWVRNISSTPFTEVQMKLLNHGPNYVVVPRSPPIAEYIASIEQVCTTLKQGRQKNWEGRWRLSLRNTAPMYNLTREEHKALEELKKDKNRMVLTADKGVSMVMIDNEYIKKAEEILRQPTYKPIPTDPTNKHKNKLISLLKNIKTEGGIYEVTYRRLPYRGKSTQILWVTQSAQDRNAT